MSFVTSNVCQSNYCCNIQHLIPLRISFVYNVAGEMFATSLIRLCALQKRDTMNVLHDALQDFCDIKKLRQTSHLIQTSNPVCTYCENSDS